MVAGRNGDGGRPDLEKDIARVGRKLGGLTEELNGSADIDVRLVATAGAGDLEGADVLLAGAEGLSRRVGLDSGRDVVRAEPEDDDAVHDAVRHLPGVGDGEDGELRIG